MNGIDKPMYLYEGESLEIQTWNEKKEITFDELVQAVIVTSEGSQASALKAINRMLTMRNWLIGYYIVEFEQKGKERAQYGDKLLKRLESAVNQKGLTETLFKWSRLFYRLYPQMATLFVSNAQYPAKICASVMHQFTSSAEAIISRLSFTHLREIMSIDDALVRYFYEQECMRCSWSVRDLRRQIGTNLHIRVGLKAKTAESYITRFLAPGGPIERLEHDKYRKLLLFLYNL